MKEVKCTKCGVMHELKGKQYLCKPCKKAHQNRLHKHNRDRWYEIVGNTCIRCGYNKSTAALDFHHRDPSEKLFGIGTAFNARNPDTCSRVVRDQVLMEVAKCDLLCSNCHREIHDDEN